MSAEAADGGDVGRDNKLVEKIAEIPRWRERYKALLDDKQWLRPPSMTMR